MIANDQQLETTLERIARFQEQVAHLCKTETDPVNYRAAVSGFLAEIDRMQLEVRKYLRVAAATQGDVPDAALVAAADELFRALDAEEAGHAQDGGSNR